MQNHFVHQVVFEALSPSFLALGPENAQRAGRQLNGPAASFILDADSRLVIRSHRLCQRPEQDIPAGDRRERFQRMVPLRARTDAG